MSRTGAQALVEVLRRNQVDHVFGLPGGHLVKFYDALYEAPDINVVLTKHEAGAAFMACGFAQVSGRPAVAVGTVGPGATNLVSGVATALMDSVPMLVLTGQVGSSAVGKGALQESTGEGRTFDQVELFRPLTKHAARIVSAGRLGEMVSNALRMAVNERPGPVHLDVLADVFAEDAGDRLPAPVERFAPVAGREQLRRMAQLLTAANRPAILAGRGALGAAAELARLVHEWRIPIATTLPAKGLVPEDEPLSLGCLGIYGTIVANKYLRGGVDVLLAVGTSFHEFTTHAWDPRFLPRTALLQIDIDGAEVGKNYEVGVGVVGDAAATLTLLIEELASLDGAAALNRRAGVVDELTRLKRDKRHFDDPLASSDDMPVKPQRLMLELRRALPPETIVFGDIGNSVTWVEAYFPSLQPGTFFIGSNLAAMGYGTAACVGGKLAARDRPVVCVCGDGDFQMHGMEVMTAVNYELPVVWVVMENGKLAMVQDIQDTLMAGRRIGSSFHNPDFVRLAEAFGARGFRAEEPSQIGEVIREAITCGQPAVVAVPIDPDVKPPFDARAEAMVRAWGTSPPLLKKLAMVPELLRRR